VEGWEGWVRVAHDRMDWTVRGTLSFFFFLAFSWMFLLALWLE